MPRFKSFSVRGLKSTRLFSSFGLVCILPLLILASCGFTSVLIVYGIIYLPSLNVQYASIIAFLLSLSL
nr:MAG TPA: hypothetical protein [Caudoviricetes sp.]